MASSFYVLVLFGEDTEIVLMFLLSFVVHNLWFRSNVSFNLRVFNLNVF